MLDSKFFFTLIGLIVAVFAICNTNISPSVKENFWGIGGRSIKFGREMHPNGPNMSGAYSLQNKYQGVLGNDKFVQYPNFQGILSPRSASVDYGANIRYNMPSYENQGIPYSPLAFGDMAKENYQNDKYNNYGCSKASCAGECGGGGCGMARCGKGGVTNGGESLMNSDSNISSNSDYVSAMNEIYSSDATNHVIGDGLVAVGDMTTLNSLGVESQPIMYDRYLFSNQKDRNSAYGDPIRGDLPITPCLGNWFSVHPNVNIALRQGAMNVMGGQDAGTARAMNELVYATSGKTTTTIGGVDLSMTNEFVTSLGAGGGDIKVTAFP